MEPTIYESKVAFIYLPFTSSCMPPLGIPLLSAFLKSKEINCKSYDLNIELYNYLIDQKRVNKKFDEIKNLMMLYDNMESLPRTKYQEYTKYLKLLMKENIVCQELSNAINIFKRKKNVKNSKELYVASQILSTALEVSTYKLSYFNNNPANYSIKLDYNQYKLLEAEKDWREIIIWFYNNIDKICAENEIISFSWCYYTQIHFLLLACSYIKDKYPNKKIVIGGPVATGIIKESDVNINNNFLEEYGNLFDVIMIEDGEYPWLDFLEGIKNSKIYSSPQFNCDNCEKDTRIPEIILPDYNALPIDLYLTPNLVLPFITSRHCYWGRCKFCTHSLGYSKYKKYDSLSITKILKKILINFNINSIYFVDEGMAINTALDISKWVIDNNIKLNWMTQMRFEKYLENNKLVKQLSVGGCKYLAFGMESANDRVLSCIDKGTTKKTIQKALLNCAKNKIYANLMFFYGFPTETKDEAMETFEFIIKNDNNIAGIGMGYFTLTPHSYVYDNQSEFGIYDVDNNSNYKVTIGLSKKEAFDFYKNCEKYINLNYYRGQAFYHRTFYLISFSDIDDPIYPLGFTNNDKVIEKYLKDKISPSNTYQINNNLARYNVKFDFFDTTNKDYYPKNKNQEYFCYNIESPIEKIFYISKKEYHDLVQKKFIVMNNDNKNRLMTLIREGVLIKNEY